MKILFPKQISATIAASLCFLSLGQAQENNAQQDRDAGQTTTTQENLLEGDVTGKIMPLKTFLASQQTGRLTTLDKDAQYDDGGIQPLVLVVDSRATTQSETRTNIDDAGATDRTDTTTQAQTLPATTERAYILVFQDDGVKDKAEKVAKEGRDRSDDTTATQTTTHKRKHVRVSGERSYHGGVMAIMVREIDESAVQDTTRDDDRTNPATDIDPETGTRTGTGTIDGTGTTDEN